MMAPVQPMPTMTASTSFNRVTMPASPSGKVRDRPRRRDVALVAIGVDLVGIDRRQAGKTEHLPGDLVAVPAIHRIGEEAFHHDGEHPVEKTGGREMLELGLALLHLFQGRGAV